MNEHGPFCINCGMGHYQTVTIPYICWMNHRQIVVPEAPAQQCDICGDIHYNPVFIRFLHYLIEQGTYSNRQKTAAKKSMAKRGKAAERPLGRSAKS